MAGLIANAFEAGTVEALEENMQILRVSEAVTHQTLLQHAVELQRSMAVYNDWLRRDQAQLLLGEHGTSDQTFFDRFSVMEEY